MCGHLMRPARVCSSCRESDHETHELYSTLETLLPSSLLCCDTDVLRPSFWRTDKISVKKFGCSPVHFEQRDTVQPKEKRKSPLAFHTITGCDTTGPFAGIGKQSALKIFDSLSKLVEHQGEHCPLEESVLADAEAFVCQLYNHGTLRRSRYQRRESSSISQGKEEL